MSLRFIKSGLQTSIQGAGRIGYMHQGISRSGAMDSLSLQLANHLVFNPINQAAIEITLVGPVIEFTQALSFAICGAEFELELNGQSFSNNEVVHAKAGDVLTFKKLLNGIRAYLAIAGKIDVDKVFSNQSTHLIAGFGGFNGRPFIAGDRLNIIDTHKVNTRSLPSEYKPVFSGHYLLRCVEGLEAATFDDEAIKTFYNSSYSISNDSNRMGLRLETDTVIESNSVDMISSGLVQGSIQVPPSGMPIISSVDGQTIGGYPRIANVISSELHILGQLKAGDRISFSLLSHEEAINQFKSKQVFLDKLFC